MFRHLTSVDECFIVNMSKLVLETAQLLNFHARISFFRCWRDLRLGESRFPHFRLLSEYSRKAPTIDLSPALVQRAWWDGCDVKLHFLHIPLVADNARRCAAWLGCNASVVARFPYGLPRVTGTNADLGIRFGTEHWDFTRMGSALVYLVG